MSTLRRRFLDQSSSEPSREATPDRGEEVRVVPLSKLKSLTTKKRSKRRNGFIFGLGGLFGVIVMAFFANQQDVLNMDSLMGLNFDSIVDVIPAGILREAKDITVRILQLFPDRHRLKLIDHLIASNTSGRL